MLFIAPIVDLNVYSLFVAQLDKKYLAADKAYQTAKLAEQKARVSFFFFICRYLTSSRPKKSRKTSYSASKAAEQAAEAVTKSAGNEKELAKVSSPIESIGASPEHESSLGKQKL